MKAFLFFNDTFEFFKPSGEKVQINEEGIYNGKAIQTKRQPESEQKQWIDP